jgi:hypothetical protein
MASLLLCLVLIIPPLTVHEPLELLDSSGGSSSESELVFTIAAADEDGRDERPGGVSNPAGERASGVPTRLKSIDG